MKISDVMFKRVISLPQNATLNDILQAFVKNHIDALPFVDAAQRLVGFVTVHDLIQLFLPRYYELLRDYAVLQDKGQLASLFDLFFTGMGPGQDKLILGADVMNTRLQWVQQDHSLLEAASLLQTQRMQRLPVIDKDSKLVGLITDFEIVLALLRGSAATTAASAMP